ncbi:hypothetical protein RMSM_06607 [Rhodopirellula maiorica SM1]|uniref:Uncharacterized protein n=1 Tax=Rhodopirellula maiorica SM1 TaxID=1265738 RepID=M5RAE3_9BACT|nr:hypothetical protein RMSM_06607 [Rhodopirellula maiorica SM1]
MIGDIADSKFYTLMYLNQTHSRPRCIPTRCRRPTKKLACYGYYPVTATLFASERS